MYPVKRPKRRIWKGLAVTLAVFVLLTAGYFLARWEFSLSLEHLGEDALVIGYGESCPDPGAQVLLRGGHILREGIPAGLPIHTEGAVDTDTVGTYTVTYSADLLWWSLSDSRTVQVVDRTPPEITLTSDPDRITDVGEGYEEEGYRAYDEYDGDLTDRVIRVEENGVVTYTVTDSSGNRAEVTRQINYGDIRPPEITLLGDGSMTISIGSYFEDPGYSAWDDSDGDMTAQVAVSGWVDIYTAGSYTLTYTVTDSLGNRAEVDRTVEVTAAVQPQQVTPEGKVIYLTFDDGPSAYTSQLLDILAKYDVKATFFVVGNNAELMRRIAEGGHSIGIHSVSHNYRQIYASQEAYFEDLRQMRRNIYDATGVWTTLVRFPGGSSNTVSCFNDGVMTALTQAVEAQGFQYFDWNVDSNDAGGAKDSATVFDNVVRGVQRQDVSIVLQHDTQSFSVEAVEDIILWGLENGYTFLPLDATSPDCHHSVNN